MLNHYHWPFLGEALGLGLLTALTCFRVYIRALRSQGTQRRLWLGLSSLVAGLGVWATNFSTILAFDPGFAVSYDLLWATLSLGVTVTLAVGFAPTVTLPGTWRPALLGGVYTGIVLALLQVVTVHAWVVPATLLWDAGTLLAAGALGAFLTAAALAVALPSRRWWERAIGAALLTAAVIGQQLVSMAGLEIRDPISPAAHIEGISSSTMALVVAAVTVALAGAAFLLAAFDRRSQRISRQRMRELADAALDGLVMCEDGVIVDANAGFTSLVGLDKYQLRGRAFTDFVVPEHRSRLPDAAGRLREIDLFAKDGSQVPVEIVARDLAHGGGRRRVLAVRDVRERRKAEEQIYHLAYHDSLTGLPNRLLFRENLECALLRARREGHGLAVLCLDLDRFKAVNDTMGHPIGDVLLRAVADRLLGCLRDVDTVARLGGDEFAIVLPSVERPEQAAALAHRLVEAVSAPYELDGHEVSVGASIGISLVPGDGDDPDRLLKNADMALYRAKADGRDTYRFFERDMDARLQARRVLELELRKAFAQGDLELFYQPIVNLESGRISGCEALTRWNHAERGMIPPTDFIPLAEEIGLIGALGEWVLRQACAEAATWPEHIKIAVNLSPLQFKNRNLPQVVFSALASSGLSANRLELEITESVLLQENDANLATLHRIRALGVRIAMDDFGTGYSSLSYLRSFPFDKIKIDRSFVQDVPRSADCMAIVRAVTSLGNSLGITTTAEGVETTEQLERLRNEGCTEVQGFLFSEAVPAKALEALFNQARQAADRAA